MKKLFSIFLAMLLCLQYMTPIMAVAVTIDGNGEVSLEAVEMEAGSTKKNTKIKLTLNIATSESHESIINVSQNFMLVASDIEELVDEQGNSFGTYQVKENNIHLTVNPNTSTNLVFYVEGEVPENTQNGRVLFNFGETSKELNLPNEWVSSTSTEESSTVETSEKEQEATTQTSESQKIEAIPQKQPYRGSMNVADIYTSLGLMDNFLTDMNLTFEDALGNPVVNPTVNDTIDFGFTFLLPETVREKMQAGDYYTIQLPDTVKIAQQQSYPLLDNNGIQYATVTITTNGLVTITFTNEVQAASEIQGEFHFTGTFNRVTIEEPGRIIIIPKTHENLQVTVNVKPNYTGNNIAKAGHFDRVQNPSKIIWNVDINMGMDSLNNAQVSESFPVGTTYESVKVYQMKVDFSGNIIANSAILVDSSEYSVDSNGTVTFNSQIDKTYRIEYTTTINDDKKPASGGKVLFLNKATLKSENVHDAIAQATVSANYGKEITKLKGNYDSTKQIINWTLNYNYGEKTITGGVIKDTFQNPNMTLVANSLKLFEVTFASNGTAVKGNQLVEGTDYQLVPKAAGFEITFVRSINTAVLINYQTGYDGIVDTTIPIGNTVETTSGQTSSGTGSFVQQNVIKKLGNVDYNAQTVGWNISININKYTMNNWQFTDTASEGLSLKTSTFKIYDQDAKRDLVEGQDYTFAYNPTTRVINVSFINSYSQTNHAFRISYTDDYEPASNPSPDLKFVNSAHVEWVSSTGQTIKDDDSQTFFPNTPTRYDGLKSGAYNAVSKEITWSVAIDYRDSVLQNGKIIDKLTAGQNYIPNSIKIYTYTVGVGGEIIKGNEITPTQYLTLGIQEPSDSNNQTLIINIPNNVYGKYLTEFKTSLENQLVHKTYVNDAVFSNDNYQSYNLHAEVTVNRGDELVTKSGVQDSNGFVQWAATINGSQSTLYETTIVDKPSPNQAIDLNSLKLFETTVDPAGNLTKAGQLVLGQDYTVTLETNNITGQQVMTIKLINDYLTLRKAIMLSYQTMVFLETNQGSVTNQLDISSTGTTQTIGGRNTSVDVISGSGGGSATGVRGLVNIRKVDEIGQQLPFGGTFELLDKNGNQVLRSGTVDANGLIAFGALPYGNYILKETNTLTNLGYTISQELATGIPITISAATNQGPPIVVQNKLGVVKLTKVNEQGQPLAGAKFQLEKYDGIADTWSITATNQSLVTVNDGTVTINGLNPGKYRLTEIEAPQNYIMNNTSLVFDVVVNELNQLVPVGLPATVTNYVASIQFKKTDEQGSALQGSIFNLFKQGDSTTILATATSNALGEVLFEKIGPGNYEIREQSSTGGFLVNTQTMGVITIPAVATAPIGKVNIDTPFVNYQGSVSLTKYGNSSTGRVPLSGVQFNLEDEQGQVVRTGTIDTNGKLKFENLAPGKYYFSEQSLGSNTQYILNSQKVEAIVVASASGEPEVVQVEMDNYQGAIRLKKVDSTGKALAGAEFTLYNKADDSIVKAGLTSDSNGVISQANLAPGDYYLKETQAPLDDDGKSYVINENLINFTVVTTVSGQPDVLDLQSFENYQGSVSLTKYGNSSTGRVTLSGVQFNLEDEQGQVVRTGTTDTNGKLKFENLAPGKYYFSEQSLGSNTQYILNSQKVEAIVVASASGEPEVVQVEMDNYQGAIRLKKVDSTGKALAGAKFTLYNKADDSIVKAGLTSDSNGVISQANLAPGDYYLKETQAPLDGDGKSYVINENLINFTVVTTVSGQPDVLDLQSFENYQGSVSLTKYGNSSTGRVPLSGVQFNLEDDQGQVVRTGTTDTNGKLKFENLAPGKYYFSEQSLGSNTQYILNSEKVEAIVVASASGEPEVVQVEMDNYQGAIRLKKVDSTGKALAGAKFTLYNKADDSIVKAGLTSDSNGVISQANLAPGDYYLKETQAPLDGDGKSYVINENLINFTVVTTVSGQPDVLDLQSFENYQGSVSLTKYGNSSTGRVTLSGVQFNLEDDQGQVVRTGTTDTNGKLKFENLAPGKYYFSEQSLGMNTQYILNSQKVEAIVVASASGEPEVVQVEMDNYQGAIRLKKIDSTGKALAGAEFTLYNKADDSIVKAGLTSDSNGVISQANLAPGDYYLKETQAPLDGDGKSYVINENLINFTVVTTVSGQPDVLDLQSFENYQGSVSLTKYGNSSTGRVTLSGVQFNLEDDQGQVVRTGTTDTNGKLKFENLAPGKYYFSEQSLGSNTQYILNSEKVEAIVVASASGEPEVVQVEMDNYQGAIRLKKVDSTGKGLSGAEFTLYNKIDDSIVKAGLTSDSNGLVLLEDLAPGNYYLKETKAPVDNNGDSYIINDYPINFTIDLTYKGKPATLDLQDFQNFKGKIGLTKVGLGDLPIAGAKFELYQALGSEEVLVPVNGKNFIEADASGILAISELEPGSYKLVEVDAPKGYIINLQPIYFTIKPNESGLPAVERFSIMNYEMGIKARKVSDKNKLLPEFLANATFEIRDVNNQPVQVYDNENNAVFSFSSDNNGDIQVTGLEEGSYTLVETSAPNGFVRNTEGLPFEIKSVAGTPQHIVLDLGDIVNYQGRIQIQKLGEENQPLTGGQFELQDEKGQVIEVINKAGLATKQLTAVDGEIFATGIAPGNYYLVETEAPDGYILEANPKVLPVVINPEGTGEAGAIFTGELTNYQGDVLLNKISEGTNKQLEGAVFDLFSQDGKMIKSSLKTNKEGQIEVAKLAPGDYYFIEEKAPEGYEVSKVKQAFTIQASAIGKPEQVVLTIVNKLKPNVPKEETIGKFGEQIRNGFIIGGGVLIIGVVGYVLWRKKKKE